MVQYGNLRFCDGCENLMIAQAEKDLLPGQDALQAEQDVLVWICSIECPYSKKVEVTSQIEDASAGPIILSQTTDSDFTFGQNPHNDFTKYDPTLLRTRMVCPYKNEPEHEESPEDESEMIVFKQNIVTAHSYYICTVCDREVPL